MASYLNLDTTHQFKHAYNFIMPYFILILFTDVIFGDCGQLKTKIEVLQQKCIRLMTFSDFNSHTNNLFSELKILKVRDVIKFQQLRLVYDFYNNALPFDLHNLFVLNSDIHNYQLTSISKNLLHIPRIMTTTYGIKSL